MKRYYNSTTKEWYNEGQSLTRRVKNGVFTGILSSEQLRQWGFVEYKDPVPTPEERLAQGKIVSEDLDFCNKVKALGYKIYADVGLKCPHIGKVTF